LSAAKEHVGREAFAEAFQLQPDELLHAEDELSMEHPVAR
jgi:hypothetical protein